MSTCWKERTHTSLQMEKHRETSWLRSGGHPGDQQREGGLEVSAHLAQQAHHPEASVRLHPRACSDKGDFTQLNIVTESPLDRQARCGLISVLSTVQSPFSLQTLCIAGQGLHFHLCTRWHF